MKSERIKIRLMSAWEKSILISPHGIRGVGQEICEVDTPTPEFPWEGNLINGLVSSLSNIHVATRTHETGYLAQLFSSIVTSPVSKKHALPQVYR